VLYLATASGPLVRDAMTNGLLGQMVTPDAGNRLTAPTWALDNGCFTSTWTPHKWQGCLDRHRDTPGCLFAVVPDVVADATATNQRWATWHGAVRNRGYRAAYVAQNGCQSIPASAGAVFIGGDTAWKLGPAARRLAAEAKRRGLWLHMGRVNSLRRLRYAADIGCDSADGTYLAFGPDQNLPNLLAWLYPTQPSMFGGVA
jgi:hypothetical protein